VRECYSHAYYWKIYLFNVSFICGFVPFRTFLIFYARDTMHIGLEKFGRVMAVRDGVQIVVFLLLGPIVDRFHPIRAGVAANVLAFVACLLGMLFTRGEVSFVILAVGIYGAVAIFQASTAALGPRILPTRQYGQFCSANAVIFHLGLMVALPVSGWVFDRLGYRYVYAWFTGWTLISSVMIVLLYIDWKKLGGDEGYVAPEVEEEC
jgi:predicted MFS family arabinose efflux permease